MSEASPAGGTWLVVGLGNPGPRYARNRHNIGAIVLDALAAELGARFSTGKTQAVVASAKVSVAGSPSPSLLLAKPTTYMNLSGGPTAGLLRYFKVSPDQLIVVHDDLDLPFASLRLKHGGGEGGHNGLRSVTSSLGTKDYRRLRIGVGRPPGRMDPADFVLRDFSTSETKRLDFMVPDAVDAVLDVVRLGWDKTQTRFNAR